MNHFHHVSVSCVEMKLLCSVMQEKKKKLCWTLTQRLSVLSDRGGEEGGQP